MSEWTFDLVVPTADVDEVGNTWDAGNVDLAPPDTEPHEDPVDDLVDDIDEMDLVDWFA